MSNPNKDSVDLAKDEALRQRKGGQAKQMILWFAALIVGAILGWMQVPALNELFNFVATVFTRLFSSSLCRPSPSPSSRRSRRSAPRRTRAASSRTPSPTRC